MTTNLPELTLEEQIKLERSRRVVYREATGHTLNDKNLKANKLRWQGNPVAYAKERLKIILTKAQVEILTSVRDNRYTLVMAHHALGKTFVAAIAQIWWLDCWDQHIGYMTAPTWKQALTLTFKQAKRMALTNKLGFDVLNTGTIRDKDPFRATERFIQALNADSGEGFQGEHTSVMLIGLDEATGVPKYIYESGRGLMTHSDCRWLEIGNPTDEATQFGGNSESPNYNVLAFSALDHENIEAELKALSAPFPGAVSLLWLFENIRDECEVVDSLTENCFEFYSLTTIQNSLNGTPAPQVVLLPDGKIDHEASGYCFYKPSGYFESRVLGQFPTESSQKVIPKGWLTSLPVQKINPVGIIQIGCDIARFGDDRTTMFVRIGNCVILSKIVRKLDNLEVTAAIRDLVEETLQYLKKEGIEKVIKDVIIKIDVTGGLGTAPFDLLKADGYNVVAVNSSETAKNNELYVNVRSELWFSVRDRVKDKELDFSRLPLDIKRVLRKELGTPSYGINAKGKKLVEEKKITKKNLGASPDLADGLNLAFYAEVVKTSGSSFEEHWY